MSTSRLALMAIPFCLSLLHLPQRVDAQQAGAKTTAPAAESDGAAEKAKLLDSDCWRRAMFELNEWFRTQSIYSPEAASRIRSDFATRVDGMSAQELREVLADMEAKFRILDNPEVQETRAWFAQYMAVLAERRRAELLADFPDFPTMTAAELNQAILKIQGKKSSQSRFNQTRQARVDAQKRTNEDSRAARTAAQNRGAQRPAYRSPYRPPPVERPFDDAQVGSRRSMTIGPAGGVWMNLGF